MHHGEHPDVIGFDDVNDGVGERMPEVAPGVRRAVDTNEHGASVDLRDECIDVAVKPLAEAGGFSGSA